MIYYTYAHTKPDGEIFYIGKGSGRRAWSKRKRNPHWNNIVAKYGYQVQILGEFDTEEDAFKEEIELIQHFSKFQKLCNMTGGGDGVSGYRHTEEVKAKHSSAMSGKNNPMFGVRRFSKESPNFKGTTIATNLETGETLELNGKAEIKSHGFNQCAVSRCVNGKYKSHKGHTFKRVEK